MAPKILSETAQEPLAVRFRRKEEPGPTYVKIGQMLSHEQNLPQDSLMNFRNFRAGAAMSDKDVRHVYPNILGPLFL